MKTVKIIKTGVRTDGSNWALVETSNMGFILKGFVVPESPLEVGESQIPTQVYNAIKFQA